MALFQIPILNKYLKKQNQSLIAEKWNLYKKHFFQIAVQENIRESKEEQYQEGFLRDLFVKILGYTLNPDENFNLTTEKKNVKDSKKADGAIIVNQKVIGVIELKSTLTTDLGKIETQAFGYKNNQQGCIYVISSNFEKLRFYVDNAIEHIEFNLFKLTEKEFEILYLCLGYENIVAEMPKKMKEESLNQEDIITKKLYKDYSEFKIALYLNLSALNPQFESLVLFKKSQKLLDRFLFIFFAEDRNLLQSNSIRGVIKFWKTCKNWNEYRPLYQQYQKFFEFLNSGIRNEDLDVFPYNGGLFAADEVLDQVKIDDQLLYHHTLKLSEYDFLSEVDVTILGHIFENSLDETPPPVPAPLGGESILNALKTPLPIGEGQGVGSKRKKDGIFYTPKYITKYIVENTVGRLCNEEKEKLQIIENQYIIDKKRKKNDTQILVDKLKVYRNWLLEITIIDPACGSGAFLNEALNFLIDEHAYIDELEAKLFGDSLVLSDVEKSILENNLFGVDLNEESVEISKLSLWLRTARPNRKLNDLNNNIKCGNSLIDSIEIAGEKAFDWHKEFPHIFKKGGFDVVIGNPPYFNIQTLGVGSKEAKWIQNNYAEIWQDKSDILFYFIYKAMQISKSEIGYIISNAFLFSDKAQKLRNVILEDKRLAKIVNFEKYMVFEDASITSCMTIFSKNHSAIKAVVLKEKKYSETEITNIINNPENAFDIQLEKDNIFALVTDEIGSLNKKIDKQHKKLQDVCDVGKGMETATNSVFSFDKYPVQFPKEFIKKRMIGENINRYSLKEADSFVLYFEDIEKFEELPKSIQEHLQANYDFLANRATVKNEGRVWWRYSRPMHKEYYHLSKIWCSYRGKENAFFLDESADFIGLTNTTVIFDTNKNYSMKYILALLNSKLLNFRYKSIGKQTGAGIFEYFANGVGKLPIPFCENQQPFIEKANLMLVSHKDLQKISKNVQDNIQREFNLAMLPKRLQNWYELDFSEFLKELEKHKVKLTLSNKTEWQEYFSTESKKAAILQAQIQQTDKEIDKLVYALYELTEEEIKIVENGK